MIKLSSLQLKLPGFTLGRISLEIATGEYFVLLGPTGAGKSVLLSTIVGLNRGATGSIIVSDVDVSTLPVHKRGLGVVFQDQCLFDHMRVYDNIAYALKISGTARRETAQRVEAIAEDVNITSHLAKYPDELSGGQRQRVAIARALIARPKYVLLDEPLCAIDVGGRAVMRNLLRKLQNKYKLTVLHVTHDFVDALVLADRMGVMNQGQLIECGSCQELFNRPGTMFVADFLGSGNLLIGEVIPNNGQCLFVTEHNRFTVGPQKISGRAYMMVRPEHIVLSREPLISSARNSINGKVKNIVPRSAGTASIEIDTGDLMRATLLAGTIDKMKLNIGDDVYLTFKSSAVHIIEHN